MLLGVGPRSRTVAVPFANVRRVEVREHRSRKVVGAVIGALFGGVAGAILGNSSYKSPEERRYQRERDFKIGGSHYPRGVRITLGAIFGGIGGAWVGGIFGSFIKTDTWLDAPRDWVVQYSESGSATPEASARAGACPSFDTDTR